MICPKCKTKVSKEDAVCPNCNLRLIFKCPRCGKENRLGSVTCSDCGYTFVKFCPKCHSANFASSSVCRKCGESLSGDDNQNIQEENLSYNVVETNEDNEQSEIQIQEEVEVEKENKEENPDELKKVGDSSLSDYEKERPLLFYIDFINLENTFKKYNKEEFRQKVLQNIKNTVKIAFGEECEFINEHSVVFKFNYKKTINLLDKIEYFEKEFLKFNQILEKTLDTGLKYKFAISTIDEVRKNHDIIQLKLGSEKDVIVSVGTYAQLNGELSLIKISPDSYKMIFLDKKPVFEQTKDEKYNKALKMILDNLSNSSSEIRAISLNASRGVGKTHLLNEVYEKSYEVCKDSTVLFAQCSALTQISPYGLIQNLLMSYFNCLPILSDDFNIKNFEKKVLQRLNLDKIDQECLTTIANLIYPMEKEYYENILINKQIAYKHLKDIFLRIKKNDDLILIIDDFDLIDESSYGFLKYLVTEDYFAQGAKFILGYKNEHSIAVYFQSNKFNDKNSLNISLRCFNVSESKTFVKKVLQENAIVPDEIISQIAYNAQGNIAYIEQILQYLFERKILYIQDEVIKFQIDQIDIDIPATLEECFYQRLDFLKTHNEKEYAFLCIASLLGDKLNYKTLASVFRLSEEEFFDIVGKLEKKGYLKPKADKVFGFKNSLTWSYCYIRAKEEELIKEDAKKLLVELNNKIISTPLICPILAQIIDNKELAYNLWTKNLQYASYIGDVNIYIMAQKQSLILLENVKLDNFEYTKNNICERLGKLIYEKNPQEAKDYLAYAVSEAQKNEDIYKIIDLSGYLVKSSYLVQDYTSVIEIVDNVLNNFDINDKSQKKSVNELQIALIKSKKVRAMLELGMWEGVINIVNNEITPVLQKNMAIFSNAKWINHSDIVDTLIETNIILAESYSEQGSPVAFELISEIDKMLAKYKVKQNDNLKVQLLFAEAIANTSKGYFDDSISILQEIIKDYSYIMVDSSDLVCKWNIINLINKILKGDTNKLKEELFEAAAYANNCNNEVAKNTLKTMLAYQLYEEKTYLKAAEIAAEEMQFFSEKKVAFGALLAWYICAASKTFTQKADSYCIEICEKAVKICEKAENNNYYFKILFQELVARCYLKLGNIENAKMYCDLALQSANMNELYYLQVRLNDIKAYIARECLNQQPDKTKYDYAQNVIKMYTRTLELAKMLNLQNYTNKLVKDLASFKAHCQLNRIIED